MAVLHSLQLKEQTYILFGFILNLAENKCRYFSYSELNKIKKVVLQKAYFFYLF